MSLSFLGGRPLGRLVAVLGVPGLLVLGVPSDEAGVDGVSSVAGVLLSSTISSFFLVLRPGNKHQSQELRKHPLPQQL